MKRAEKVVVFIDVANAQGMDFGRVMARARELGRVEEARADGDFRQHHLDGLALELYAMGVEMVHCPSWPNGGYKGNGTPRRKRSDDRLLEKGVRDLLVRRHSISTYLLVTADADIIPTCQSLREQEKRVLLIYNPLNGRLGHVLPTCGFQMEKGPLRQADTSQPEGERNGGLSRIIRELDRLETGSRYLTFSYVLANLGDGSAPHLKEKLNALTEKGVLEGYPYRHPSTDQTLPAIRLNRTHPLVASALRREAIALAA